MSLGYYEAQATPMDCQMPKPDCMSKTPQRCNAHRRSRRGYCRNWPIDGKKRCRFHGGLSTGPKTVEGKASVIAAMVEGRRRWVERMSADGRKFPGGRKAAKEQNSDVERYRRAIQALDRHRLEPPPKRTSGCPKKFATVAWAGNGQHAELIQEAMEVLTYLEKALMNGESSL